jgi:hypothetical protein
VIKDKKTMHPIKSINRRGRKVKSTRRTQSLLKVPFRGSDSYRNRGKKYGEKAIEELTQRFTEKEQRFTELAAINPLIGGLNIYRDQIG